jgi:hypothetical protein
MFDDVSSNPVFTRLIALSRWPSLRWIIGVWIVLVISAVVWIGPLTAANTQAVSGSLLLWLVVGALFLCPALCSIFTAIVTAQSTKSDAHRLMLISNLSNMRIVQGHFYAALYRLFLVGLFLVTLPILAFAVLMHDASAYRDIASLFEVTCVFALVAISGAAAVISLCILTVTVTLHQALAHRSLSESILLGLGVGLLGSLIVVSSFVGFCVGLPFFLSWAMMTLSAEAYNRTIQNLRRPVSDGGIFSTFES